MVNITLKYPVYEGPSPVVDFVWEVGWTVLSRVALVASSADAIIRLAT